MGFLVVVFQGIFLLNVYLNDDQVTFFHNVVFACLIFSLTVYNNNNFYYMTIIINNNKVYYAI